MKKIKIFFILSSLFISTGCLLSKKKLSVSMDTQTTATVVIPEVASVQVLNNQLIVNGSGLTNVQSIKLIHNGVEQTLAVESSTSNKLIANGMTLVTIGVGKIFDMVLSSASGAATFPVVFSLDNGSVTAAMLSSMGATVGQILKYNGTTWVPTTPTSSQLYKGTWNANTNNPDLNLVTPNSGDYYIVTTAGTQGPVTYAVGDYIISNGATWSKLTNANSFNGRTGTVMPVAGDYTWAQITKTGSKIEDIANVDISGRAIGKVLKWDGTNWAMGDDNDTPLGTPTAGSVTNTEVSATADIAQSKIHNLTTDLAAKEAALTAGTAAQYYSGTKSWQTLNSAAVPESGATNLYFSNARVLGVLLTGVDTNLAGTIAATDSLLQALGKTQKQLSTKVDTGTFVDWSVAGVATIEPSRLNLTTANRAVVTSATGVPTASAVTTTELGHLMGVTSSIQTQLNSKQNTIDKTTSQSVSSVKIYGANATNYVELSVPALAGNSTYKFPAALGSTGQVLTTDNTGLLSWTTPATTATPNGTAGGDLSGTYPNPTITALDAAKIGGGAVSNTEYSYLDGVTSSVQTQLNAKEGSITAAATTKIFRGDKTFVTLDTSIVTENTNLYFTNARAIITPLTGYVTGANSTIAATDTILGALQKTQGQLDAKLNATSFVDWSVAGGATIAPTRINLTTTNRAVITDATGVPTASAVTNTELGYLTGVTSAIQTQLNAKQATIDKTTVQAVSTVKIYGANATNYVELSVPVLTGNSTYKFPAALGSTGQVLTTDNTGLLSWTTPSATGAPTGTAGGDLSGTYPNPTITALDAAKVGGGAVSNTEYSFLDGVTSSVQTQLNAKEASITAAATTKYFRGDKTFVTLDTSVVPENTNLYFTNARAIIAPLTGFVTGANSTVLATDTILGAFQKTQGQLDAKLNSATFVDWSIAGVATLEPTRLNLTTANRAVVTSATGVPTASAVTNTELGYLTGVTSAIQTQLNAKQATIDKTTVQAVSTLKIYGANATNYVELSVPVLAGNTTYKFPAADGSNGQVLTTDNAGNLSWTTPSATGAPTGAAGGDLSGTYPNPTIAALDAAKIGGGAISNTEFSYLDGVTSSIQTQLSAKENSITAAATTTYFRGDKTFVTLDTSVVPENTNLYFTATRSIASPITGFVTGANSTILATDTVLGAFQKTQGQLNAKQATIDKTTVQAVSTLKIYGANATNYVELSVPALAGNTTYKFPAADGSNGQVLTTDNAGNLSWTTPATGGGGAPSGAAGGDLSGTYPNPTITALDAAKVGGGAVSNTEYSYLDGVTSSVQTQLNAKEGSITAAATTTYFRGDKTFVTLDTSIVPENTNLYFTGARAIASPITGFVTGANSTILATDSILGAFQKTQGQLDAKLSSGSFVDWSIAGVATLEPTRLNLTTASRVVVTSATGVPTASAVTNTELDYLTGVTSAIQTQLNAKQATIDKTTVQAVSTVKIYGANATNYVELSVPALAGNSTYKFPAALGSTGQVLTTDNTGILSWTTPSATGAPTGAAGGDLSGTYPNPTITALDASKIGGGAVSNTEHSYLDGVTGSIQTQLNGKEGTITSAATSTYFRGDKTFVTLDTSVVPENTNLYFTGARAIASSLTGFATGANSTILATDTILGAFQKTQGQLNAKQTTIDKTTVQSVSTVKIYGANATNYVELSVPALAGNTTYKFPAADGTNGQVLTTDNAGNLSWTTPATGGGGAPSGAAGGDLSGTYPNPTITALDAAKIGGGAVSNTEYSYLDGVTGSIQTQLNGKEGTITAAATSTYFRGDKTFVTLDTSVVPENTNLYFTGARAIASPITGFATGANSTILATDTILGAFQKTQGQLDAKLSSGSFVDWSIAGVATLEPTRLNLTTASRVVVTSAIGVPTASAVTNTELGYLTGVTSAIQTQLNAKQATIDKTTVQAVSTVKIYGANATNYVELSVPVLAGNTTYRFPASDGTNGQVLTTDNAGNLSWTTPAGGGGGAPSGAAGGDLSGTYPNPTITALDAAKVGGGTVSSTEFSYIDGVTSSIQTQLNAKEGTITAGTSAQYLKGDKSLGTFASEVLATLLTGLSTATSAVIAATDSVLVSLGKLQAQIGTQTTSISGKADTTNIAQTITALSVTGLSAPVAGADAANKTYVDSFWTKGTGGNIGDIYRSTGNVGLGIATPTAKLEVVGQVVSKENIVVTGATADFATGNTQIMQSIGGTAITLNNMVNGGQYTVIIEDVTSRTYTFTNCTTTRAVPGIVATTGRSVFTILKVSTACYVTWITGF